MSNEIRNENVCLNCGHIVDYTYCSYCGQENTSPNESIIHLVKHFHGHAEEYQNSMFKSLKKLMLMPGFLTKQFIEGKRRKYTHPVRMYLIISFVYFILVMGIFDKPKIETFSKNDPESQLIFVPIKVFGFQQFEMVLPKSGSVEQYDSTQNALPLAERDKGVWRAFARRSAEIYDNYSPEKATELLAEKVHETIPKAIFILIPILGFFLWLLHNKKKYPFATHIVFCLHFNTAVFILLSIATLINIPLEHIQGTTIQYIIWQLTLFAALIYFIVALHNTYQQSYIAAAIKGILIISVYVVFILLTGAALLIYPFMTL